MQVQTLANLLDGADQSLRVVGFDYREIKNLEMAIVKKTDGSREVVYRLITTGETYSSPTDEAEERTMQRLRDLGYE